MSKTFHMNVGMTYNRPGTSEVISLNNNGQYAGGKIAYLEEAQTVLKHITISNVVPTCAILVTISAQKKYTCTIRACSLATPITPATVKPSDSTTVFVYMQQK